jgi:hypothetical protein
MDTDTPTTTFRRRVGAVTVVLAPVLFAVAELTSPTEGDDPAADLGTQAVHHGQLLLSIGSGLLASILFIPAFFALMNPVRRRGTALAHLGGGMALVGNALSGLALAGVDFMLYEASAPGVDRATVSRFLAHATKDPVGAPLLIGHFLFALGIVLLAAGLYRAGVGPRWAAVLLGLAPLLDAVMGTIGVEETFVTAGATDALLIAGAAGLAWWLMTTSNAAWEGVAAYRGEPAAALDLAADGRR